MHAQESLSLEYNSVGLKGATGTQALRCGLLCLFCSYMLNEVAKVQGLTCLLTSHRVRGQSEKSRDSWCTFWRQSHQVWHSSYGGETLSWVGETKWRQERKNRQSSIKQGLWRKFKYSFKDNTNMWTRSMVRTVICKGPPDYKLWTEFPYFTLCTSI